MSLLGKFVYHCWHRPAAAARASLAAGGPIEQWRTARGAAAMEDAATRLPAMSGKGAPLTVYFLTGRRFWYQTAFCLWTFGRQTGRPITPVILDDGSLESRYQDHLRRLCPGATIESEHVLRQRIDAVLPAGRYPTLHERRANFPLIRKLTDVHAGRPPGWRLFLDSDLLFFHRPQLLLDWLDAPSQPLRATDVATAYGYPLGMLSTLAGQPVLDLVNTGLCGLRSDEIDWERVEFWTRSLIEQAGTHYYMEQALVALLLAGRPVHAAPLNDYVTWPKPPEALECRAVMHHYVADSKRWYFRQNWRRVLSS